jgi:hypothetical protein
MPRLRQVEKAKAGSSVATVYSGLFGTRDPVTEPITATAHSVTGGLFSP